MAIRKPIIKEQYQISIDDESIITALEKYIDEKIKQDPRTIDKKIIIDFSKNLFIDNNFEEIFDLLAEKYEFAGWSVLKDIDNYCLVLV
jgi:hypothetical protein